jgi:hypothetical protein
MMLVVGRWKGANPVRALIWLLDFITVHIALISVGLAASGDLQLTPLVARVMSAPRTVLGTDERSYRRILVTEGVRRQFELAI